MNPELSEGQAFGAYHRIGVAGTGGMGVVYRAEQRPLGRVVALKITEAEGGLTRTGLMIGTSGYLSPEQIRGQQPDARSDLYALGCVMFEALAGQRPFAGENDQALLWAHASSPRPVASEICPGLGRRYDEFLIRALAVDPHGRFQSGREFGAALEAAHTERPGIRTPTYPAAPAKPPLPTQPAPPAPETEPVPETEPAHVACRSGSAEPAAIAVPGPAPPRAHPSARPAGGYVGRLAAAAGCWCSWHQ